MEDEVTELVTPLISDDASERTIWTGYGINARHVHVVAVHARNTQRQVGEFHGVWSYQRNIWDIQTGSRVVPPSRYVKFAVNALHGQISRRRPGAGRTDLRGE
jgi:hypothetical protein